LLLNLLIYCRFRWWIGFIYKIILIL